MIRRCRQTIRNQTCRQQRPCRIMDQYIIGIHRVFPYILQPVQDRKLSCLPGSRKTAKFIFSSCRRHTTDSLHIPNICILVLFPCAQTVHTLQNQFPPHLIRHNLHRVNFLMGKKRPQTVCNNRSALHLYVLFGRFHTHPCPCPAGQKQCCHHIFTPIAVYDHP